MRERARDKTLTNYLEFRALRTVANAGGHRKADTPSAKTLISSQPQRRRLRAAAALAGPRRSAAVGANWVSCLSRRRAWSLEVVTASRLATHAQFIDHYPDGLFSPALALDFLQRLRHSPRLALPRADGFSATTLRNPMRIASHIATALSAATGRSDRPNGWLLVGAPGVLGYVPSSRNSRPIKARH